MLRPYLLATIAILASGTLKGDVLCWLVGNAKDANNNEIEYAYAGVKDLNTGAYLDYVDENGGHTEGDWQVDVSAFDYDDVGVFGYLNQNQDFEDHIFQIDLYDEHEDRIAYSTETMSFEKLSDRLAIGNDQSGIKQETLVPWSVSSFTSLVPEPTSGLLALFGAAMLALKRRRA